MKVCIYLCLALSFSNVIAKTSRNIHGGEGGEGGKISGGVTGGGGVSNSDDRTIFRSKLGGGEGGDD